MKFRLNFDDEINAILIAKISQRAGNGSLNKALHSMIIEWNAIEEAGKQSKSSQKVATLMANQIDDEVNFSGLDAAFDDV